MLTTNYNQPSTGRGRWFFHIPVIIAFLAAISSQGQQSTLITHYMFTGMALNPAFAGSSNGINAVGLARQQWMGWKDSDGTKSAPQTYVITLDMPIRFIHGGLGLSVTQDQIGVFKNTAVKLAYAYKTELGDAELSFGIQGDLQNVGYDASKFKGVDQNDPVLEGLTGKASSMTVDVGIGAYYRVPEKYYIGLSADNLIQTSIKKMRYQLRRTFYLTGGYQWTVPNHPAFEILPSILFMYDQAVFQVNASALVMYNNKFYGGLGYRYQDAVSVLAGFNVKNLRIGLAYDICTSAMRKYNSGGLEVMVNYIFKIDIDRYRKSYRNTRFL